MAETYHTPIHLSCHRSLLAHRTRAHVAHIDDWHIQPHSLHKVLQRQNMFHYEKAMVSVKFPLRMKK